MKKIFSLLLGCAVMSAPAMYAEDATAVATPEQPTTAAVAEPTAEATPAPQEKSTWEKILANMPKISGYLQTGWNWAQDSYDNSHATSSFQAKRLRLIMDGKVGEKVDFRLQIEAFNGIAGSTNGNGQKNLQVMDAFATWKVMPEFKIRAGQFYTPLGYENYDISPKTLETVDFSNIVYRMACRNPYEYNFVDYGRDLGVMLMGDLFDSGKGFRYLHYDLALTNGSIPCKDDDNSSKDFYVSATVRPVKFFNIKATYNYGKYKDNSKIADGSKYNPMHRFVVGAWYNDPQGIDLRAEYGLLKSKVDGQKRLDEQGAYVLAGYHAGKWLPMVRWDMYRDKMQNTVNPNGETIQKCNANYNYNRILVGVNYQLFKNVTIQFNYHHFFFNDKQYASNGEEYSGRNQIQLMGRFCF
ncbi:MAG: porin [Sodaliphilus pleomorphus]|jgi:opacity protein-like surface antigen|uniref:porin n=1 Tax=Sodaliphilus pleomorphus TaxID=2606626 RepID=UPI0024094A6B|nr:porin [Sodaliphilus pleomorphus]MDD6476090.1 porin [Sodaliphilus pleomorphus]MDY2833291.1 porin [Sodaliphilus pleomorphus]